MNYETIKRAAKNAKVKVEQLLALSPKNDPFYCGSPGQMEKAEWFAEIYRKMGRPREVHIRRVHYWLVSQSPKYKTPSGQDYLNNDNCWGLVSVSAKYARYAGLIPIDNIVDKRNPPADVNVRDWENESPEEIKMQTDSEQIISLIEEEFICYNPSKTQSYMLEIWCEKSTMNDVLEPICQRYGANLVVGLGELSITAVNLLIKRVVKVNKPTRVFYISDFDPAGEGMPISVSRKIEYLSQGKGLDIKLVPLMLTAEQCKEYDLPRTPIKSSNLRKDDFEARHGTGATELDALEALIPGEMRALIEAELDNYFDRDKWEAAREMNSKIQRTVREFLEPIIEDILEPLDLSEFDDVELEVSELIDDSHDNWLFDSSLDYTDQLYKYKEYKD